MNISISNFKVNSISNIGSINIGKTILSHNRAVSTSMAQTEEKDQEETQGNPPPAPPIPPAPSSPPNAPASPPSSFE